MADYYHREDCRACGSRDLVKVFDLGEQPPANAFLTKEQFAAEKSYPLALYFCKQCSLVQLLDVVDPAILFGNYHYATGASAPMIDHFRDYAERTVRPRLKTNEDLVVDIGGNDGTLLGFLVDHAITLNVDPAINLAKLSLDRGVNFTAQAFTAAAAKEIKNIFGPARVITANNVFAHTDNIRDALQGVADLLTEDGTFIMEVHWVKHLIDACCFDHIYHEHLCYWSLHALIPLLKSVGLRVYNVEVVPTQGLSLRVSACKDARPHSYRVIMHEDIERTTKLDDVYTYTKFALRAEHNARTLQKLIIDLTESRATVVGYGAPAKGNTLLNYCHTGPDVIRYLTDTTAMKQGRCSPGMHIPVVRPERLMLDATPDYALLLSWNFKDSILEKESTLRALGTKFIVPIPEISIV